MSTKTEAERLESVWTGVQKALQDTGRMRSQWTGGDPGHDRFAEEQLSFAAAARDFAWTGVVIRGA
jgi:hypothetical protein